MREGAQLGDRLPITGHGDVLAGRYPVENLSTVIPELTNRCLSHALSVSPVRLSVRPPSERASVMLLRAPNVPVSPVWRSRSSEHLGHSSATIAWDNYRRAPNMPAGAARPWPASSSAPKLKSLRRGIDEPNNRGRDGDSAPRAQREREPRAPG